MNYDNTIVYTYFLLGITVFILLTYMYCNFVNVYLI